MEEEGPGRMDLGGGEGEETTDTGVGVAEEEGGSMIEEVGLVVAGYRLVNGGEARRRRSARVEVIMGVVVAGDEDGEGGDLTTFPYSDLC